MRNLNFKYLDAWLFDSEVGHFNVEAVEVNAIETLVDGVGKTTLARSLDSFLIVKRAALVENSEQIVELDDCAGVLHKQRPVACQTVLFKFINNLWEVPREGEHVGMLLLRELSVDPDASVDRLNAFTSGLLLLESSVCEASLGRAYEHGLTGLQGKSLAEQGLAGAVRLQEHSAAEQHLLLIKLISLI